MKNLKLKCPDKCPGCKIWKEGYEEILLKKILWMKQKLEPYSKVINEPCITIERKTVGYRDRVCLKAEIVGNRWNFGFIRNREFVPVEHCILQNDFINDCIDIVRNSLPPEKSIHLAYYIQTLKQIVFVLKTKEIPSPEFFEKTISMLKSAKAEGIHVHLNPSAGKKVILKSFVTTLSGKYFSKDEAGFLYTPLSFRQMLSDLHSKSIRETVDFFKHCDGFKVIDLFSGIGVTLKKWTELGMPTLGIELGKDTISCARLNAPDADILMGRCDQRIPQINEWLKLDEKSFYLYMNPPRMGIGEKLLHWIKESKPEKIAYMSCNPISLSSDLKDIESSGYVTEAITPYDFFPYTHHIECMALLKKL